MTRRATKADLFSNPSSFFGLGFGSGLSVVAPGTFGTMAAIPIYMILASLGQGVYFTVVVAAVFAGIQICGQTAKQLNSHDHPAIVWDELVGYLLTMLFVPMSLLNMALGFVLFRFFDIVKPWPIKWVDQRVRGGLGIMLDDLIAAVFSGLILWAFNQWNLFGLFLRS